MMKPKKLLLIVAYATISVPHPVSAGWTCGIDGSLLPGISALDIDDDQLKAYVGPYRRASDSEAFIGNALLLGHNGDWTIREDAEVPRNSAKSCINPPPDEKLHERLALDLPANTDFEQNISVCEDGPGRRWGGISFYSGEGSWGVGGIVEENMATGGTRYYRPRPLVDSSVSHLKYFGERLWIGTESFGECGEGVGVGVLSAYFANDTMYADRPVGACGFIVSGMVVHSDALWISTEMGLSKVSKSGDRYKPFSWTNYVPTGDAKRPLREVTCDALYTELFQSANLASAPPNDSGHPYAVLWDRVSKLRPNFAWQYVRRINGLEPRTNGENPK
jgi:hypothetical protein